jgi:pyridoxal phosphate enzyme (YggS family)
MHAITINLANIQTQIREAEQRYGRTPGSVQLVAVTKQQSIASIQQAITAGQLAFGENYLQEALPKIHALSKFKIEWHFIGHMQTNKTRAIATHFAWAHSIDRLTIAQRLNDQRPNTMPPLNICLEVNLDNESNKSGIVIEELPSLVAAITQLPRLKLRGLMAIPAPRKEFVEQRAVFEKLHLTLQKLQQQGFNLDTLSMGMSHDFVAAIAAGATMVRIGTAIFGERKR